jgi:pimeloyl-ACP methyl ester carboxylesterase
MCRISLLLVAVGCLLASAYSLQAQAQPLSPNSSEPTQAKVPEGALRRRAMFGAQLESVTKVVRERQKLDSDGGVVIERVFPGTSAGDAEFKVGDVILAIDGANVAGVPMFLERVAKARAGDVVTLDVVRDGVKAEKQATLKEMPREKGEEGYDVIYGSVTSRGARLRTIITRPKTEGRHPAVMLIQGYGCMSIDNAVGEPSGFTRITRNLARHGYVTLRVDRPGCGDSEGGPCRDVDFNTELDGYTQALRALKEFDFVDADNAFLFGHSMGGTFGPLIAVEVPVRGLAVYGTSTETWFEQILGQRRRIAMLEETNAGEVDRQMLGQARFWYSLLIERKTPREILEQSRELRSQLGTLVTDDKYVAGRHYTFLHQASDKNMAEVWAKVGATRLSVGGKIASPSLPTELLHPRVLAIWGASDWHVSRAPIAWIAEIVNRVQPGHGSFLELQATDHFFLRAISPEESFRHYSKPVKGVPSLEVNPVVAETLRVWLDESAGRAKKRSEQQGLLPLE